MRLTLISTALAVAFACPALPLQTRWSMASMPDKAPATTPSTRRQRRHRAKGTDRTQTNIHRSRSAPTTASKTDVGNNKSSGDNRDNEGWAKRPIMATPPPTTAVRQTAASAMPSTKNKAVAVSKLEGSVTNNQIWGMETPYPTQATPTAPVAVQTAQAATVLARKRCQGERQRRQRRRWRPCRCRWFGGAGGGGGTGSNGSATAGAVTNGSATKWQRRGRKRRRWWHKRRRRRQWW